MREHAAAAKHIIRAARVSKPRCPFGPGLLGTSDPMKTVGYSPVFSTERLYGSCSQAPNTIRSRVCEKTRGHCCRTLARKRFPKLPRNVPGFFPVAGRFPETRASIH